VGLLMERCRGKPLWEVKTEGELEKFVLGAAKALLAVHEAGWVHGDVKESNFCVDQKGGKVRLIDFEFAVKAGTIPEGYTRGYQAPETTREEDATYSGKSDMYSFGVALEKMLSRSEIASGVWEKVVEDLKRVDAEERWSAKELVKFCDDRLLRNKKDQAELKLKSSTNLPGGVLTDSINKVLN